MIETHNFSSLPITHPAFFEIFVDQACCLGEWHFKELAVRPDTVSTQEFKYLTLGIRCMFNPEYAAC
jgi:hypothetical protein